MRSWIFQANPNQFDIDAYLEASPASISWVARQNAAKMAPGDQVFIWRAIGGGDPKLSGILAEGYIEDLPTVRADDAEAYPYWFGGAPSPEARVRVRLVRIELKHRFERAWLENDPVMAEAAISKVRIGTNFALTEQEALRLNALWRRAKVSWSYAETVAGLWAYWMTLGANISRLPGSPVSTAALRTGRVVKGMYNKVLNFRALDPTDSRKGLDATSVMDREVWSRFFDPVAGKLRGKEIVAEFDRLWPQDSIPVLPSQPDVEKTVAQLSSLGLTELLARYEKGAKGRSPKPRAYRSTSTSFERDPLVVAIARARAKGNCEVPGCTHILFAGVDGQAFVEVHHIEPLANGGADTPENVAAVCPSHHREAHHGANAGAIKSALQKVRTADVQAVIPTAVYAVAVGA